MATFLFILLHIASLLFWWPGLVATIPLHIIYAFIRGRSASAERARLATESQLVRCTQCKEQVRWDALKCKHCGAELTPLNAPPANPYSTDTGSVVVALVIAGLFGASLLAYISLR